eukprot:6035696-Karenia_brevis.AAC.1
MARAFESKKMVITADDKSQGRAWTGKGDEFALALLQQALQDSGWVHIPEMEPQDVTTFNVAISYLGLPNWMRPKKENLVCCQPPTTFPL